MDSTRCLQEVKQTPEALKEDMYAAELCSERLWSPRPSLFRLSWACCHATLGVSTAMHSEKQQRTSSLKNYKALPIKAGGGGGGGGGGVDLARCTNLQKPPHCLSRSRATCGSTAPTSSNCTSNLESSACLCAKKTWHKRLYLPLELQESQN